jgi:RHS repeat-associated protein
VRPVRGKRQYSINDKVVAVRSANGTPTSDLSWLVSTTTRPPQVAVHAATWQVIRRCATPFGGPRGQQPSSWPEQRGVLGKPEDKQTGLTSVGAREYDPVVGRFLSVDPLLTTSDPNHCSVYAYANSNPTSMADPTGLCPMAEGGGCVPGTGVTKPDTSEPVDDPGGDTGGGEVSADDVNSGEGTGYYRQCVGVRIVIAVHREVYEIAMGNMQQELARRGESWVEANQHFVGCTSMESDAADGGSCAGAGLMQPPNLPSSRVNRPVLSVEIRAVP